MSGVELSVKTDKTVQMSRTQRLYVIRGRKPEFPCIEVNRLGEFVTLNVSPPHWPFPRLQTFKLNQLIFAGGPAEPTDATSSLEGGSRQADGASLG